MAGCQPQRLLNAAKDGVAYFAGQLLEDLTKRGKAADRLQQIYEKNAGQMAQDGLDTAAIAAKIKRLKELSSTGRISELTSNVKDWQSFIKNGVSALMQQLNASNQEIQGMLEDPRMQKYFETDAPQLKALLDISRSPLRPLYSANGSRKKCRSSAASNLRSINPTMHWTGT